MKRGRQTNEQIAVVLRMAIPACGVYLTYGMSCYTGYNKKARYGVSFASRAISNKPGLPAAPDKAVKPGKDSLKNTLSNLLQRGK